MLEIQDVCKAYGVGQGRVEALADINLTLREGELLAILGSSGSGKTTLLNMMGGMDRPDSGRVPLASAVYRRLPRHAPLL